MVSDGKHVTRFSKKNHEWKEDHSCEDGEDHREKIKDVLDKSEKAETGHGYLRENFSPDHSLRQDKESPFPEVGRGVGGLLLGAADVATRKGLRHWRTHGEVVLGRSG